MMLKLHNDNDGDDDLKERMVCPTVASHSVFAGKLWLKPRLQSHIFAVRRRNLCWEILIIMTMIITMITKVIIIIGLMIIMMLMMMVVVVMMMMMTACIWGKRKRNLCSNGGSSGHSVHWPTFCGRKHGKKITSLSDDRPTICLKKQSENVTKIVEKESLFFQLFPGQEYVIDTST